MQDQAPYPTMPLRIMPNYRGVHMHCVYRHIIISIIVVLPSSYFFHTVKTVSVNGSSATGNCSSITPSTTNVTARCNTPTSSVLFDANIPTLIGLDGYSQLQILHTTISYRREIIFDFTGTFRVERIELVMFNCPEWGIRVQAIRLLTAPSLSTIRSLAGSDIHCTHHHFL